MLKLFINNGFLKSIKYAKILTRKKTQSYLKNFIFSIETFHQKLFRECNIFKDQYDKPLNIMIIKFHECYKRVILFTLFIIGTCIQFATAVGSKMDVFIVFSSIVKTF
jgi:hypothetical protein